jgi:hypothetical protein
METMTTPENDEADIEDFRASCQKYSPDAPAIVTAFGHGFAVGETATFNMGHSRWWRFKMWLRRPWRWPPKFPSGTFKVTSVTSNTFEIGKSNEMETEPRKHHLPRRP